MLYPPFGSTLPYLYSIDEYTQLQKDRTKTNNYKMVCMKIDVDKDGTPLLDWDIASKYYEQMYSNLPEHVGGVMSPFSLSSLDFEKSGGVSDVDIVVRAEEEFWNASGTSSLLFGSSKNDSSSAMKLSIVADQSLMLAFVTQCERLINFHLKNMAGTIKFKINLLPITVYNQEEMSRMYQTGATLGLPVKSALAACLGLGATDISGMDYVEKNILDVLDLTPMLSSYTQSSAKGAPTAEESGKELSEKGEESRNNDSDLNKE